jgi:hypothetical protein
MALLALAVLVPSGGFAYACTTPIDTSEAAQGRPKTALEQKKAVAWWAHAVLGGALQTAGCDRNAAGLQWLKAAAHAPGEADLRRAVAGIAAARLRGDPSTVDAYLCGKLRHDGGGGFVDQAQADAARLAGLPCADVPVLGKRA